MADPGLEGHFESTSFFDRPRLAAENLWRRDIPGAYQALMDPQQLSPTQMGWMDDKGEWKPKGNTVYDAVLNTITNPLVLIGAVLASRWPVARAADLIDWGKSMERLAKATPRLKAKVLAFGEIFEGTEVKRKVYELLDWLKGYKADLNIALSEGLEKTSKRLGRSVTYQDQIAAAMKVEQLMTPGATHHRGMGILREQVRRAYYVREHGLEGMDLAQERAVPWIEERVAGMFKERTPGAIYAAAPDELVDSIRTVTAKAWEPIESDVIQPLTGRTIREQLQDRYKDLAKQMESHRVFLTPAQLKAIEDGSFGWRENYFPHIHIGGPEEVQAAMALAQKTALEAEGMGARGVAGVLQPATKRLLKETGGAVPALDDIRMMRNYFTPETMEGIETLRQVHRAAPGLELVPRQYSLRSAAVLERYADTMGKTLGWTGMGYGPELEALADLTQKMEAGGKVKYNLMKELYFPLLSGRMDHREAQYALEWGHYKATAHNFFANPKVQNVLGEGTSKWFMEQLEKPVIQNLTWKNAGAKVSGWFYLSTLGANLSPAGLNLMQNLMTTPSMVEARYLAKGAMSAANRASEYAGLVSKGHSFDDAWRILTQKHPEMAHVFNSVESEVLENIRMAKMGGMSSLGGKVEKAREIMMSAFTTSERFNKMVAFEAGRIKALDEGLSHADSLLVGREVMEATQFPGGPFGTPSGLVKWWGPFRQFAQFPLRTLGRFIHDPGSAGRMMVGGAMVYEAGKMANLDLSRGLVFGALPAPYGPDQPFFPFPFSPPLVSIAGAVGSDIFGENPAAWEMTKRSLPLLVPGGVGLSRAASALSPRMARAVGRPYADFTAPRPDGTVPMYSHSGNLIGFKRPIDMFADAVGWTSLTGSPVTELEGYLVKQRDKIREARRQYVEALAGNDIRKAQQINEQYKRAFPNLGDIVIKQQDIQAVHLRHDVSRVERILQTLPVEARDVYGQMAGVALGEAAGAFTGVDPNLLAGGTVRSRDVGRVVPRGPQAAMLAHNRQMGQSGVPALQSEPVLRLDQWGEEPRRGPFREGFESFIPW